MAAQPWNDSEKTYLLAEIIKRHSPTPSFLLDVILNRIGVQHPDWDNILPPPGRTLHQCRSAFEQMRGPRPLSLLPGALGPQTSSPRSTSHNLKRPFQFEPTLSYANIAPKPTSTSGSYEQPSSTEQPPKKKRGRPTKAEAQAKAEAQSSSAEPSSASRTQFVGGPLAGPSPVAAQAPGSPPFSQPPAEEIKSSQLPVTRMPISSMLTPTGPTTTSASQSSSSSGKRRRGRSTRSAPEDFALSDTGTAPLQEYESPYAGMGTASQDTPARTAVLRHRDDTEREQPFTGAQQRVSQYPLPTTSAPSEPRPPT